MKIYKFEEVIRLLQEYKEQYGNCLVPQSYTTEDEIPLGRIIGNIRTGNRKISEEEKLLLDSLGFVWKMKESPLSFEEVIRLLQEYKEQYSDCLVPQSYMTENKIPLGRIVGNIRGMQRKINEQEKAMLDNLGFVWRVK